MSIRMDCFQKSEHKQNIHKRFEFILKNTLFEKEHGMKWG